MSKPIIKCIKEYMKDCPYLNELSKINRKIGLQGK